MGLFSSFLALWSEHGNVLQVIKRRRGKSGKWLDTTFRKFVGWDVLSDSSFHVIDTFRHFIDREMCLDSRDEKMARSAFLICELRDVGGKQSTDDFSKIDERKGLQFPSPFFWHLGMLLKVPRNGFIFPFPSRHADHYGVNWDIFWA